MAPVGPMSLLEIEDLDSSHDPDKTAEHPESDRPGEDILILWLHELRGKVV